MQQAGHGLHTAVDRIATLYDQEVMLRQQARLLELEPTRREAAQGLFRRRAAAQG